MYKGYKIRLYPTKEQEELLWKHVGCCRFIWNYMLNLQNENYDVNGKYIPCFKLIKILPSIKENFEWLREVDSHSLQITCKDLDFAFKLFFNKISNKPKFKLKKFSKIRFPVRNDSFYFKSCKFVTIPKVGNIKYRTDFNFDFGKCNFHCFNPRIYYKLGKWFLSFSLEYENQAQELNDFSMGIDLGIKELAVVSYDNKIEHFHNINKSKKMRDLEKRRKHYQRVMSRRIKKGSKNQSKRYIKVKNKVAKLYAKQANIRNNYIHQTTRKLVNKKPQRVVMEDLNVIGLMKNHHLAKAIQEQKFYKFIRQMQYKCEWAGIEFIQANRFYPSSKTCSCCGNVKKDLKLSDRVYRCEKCGLTIDRDENAAKNLEKYIA